jgi:hypothetical protein
MGSSESVLNPSLAEGSTIDVSTIKVQNNINVTVVAPVQIDATRSGLPKVIDSTQKTIDKEFHS